jgi:hypothetical protein
MSAFFFFHILNLLSLRHFIISYLILKSLYLCDIFSFSFSLLVSKSDISTGQIPFTRPQFMILFIFHGFYQGKVARFWFSCLRLFDLFFGICFKGETIRNDRVNEGVKAST